MRPNVILIIADALRRDAVPVYGEGVVGGSFWNEMATEGVVFEDAFAHASKTFPAIPSLLTSRVLFWRGESRGEGYRDLVIDRENLMLAEVLQEAGYETAAIVTNPHQFEGSGWEQGFRHYRFLAPREADPPYARASEVNTAFLDWLDDHPDQRPFFAYLHYMDPHNPYWAPPAYRDRFVTTAGRRGIYQNGPPDADPPLSDADLAHLKERYRAETRYLDDQLSDLRAQLIERGIWQQSVIMFTSDHGDEFMEHGMLGHGKSLNFAALRVPLLFAGGGMGRVGDRGRRVADLVRHVDVAPTILEAAGVATPSDFEGRSLLALLSRDAQPFEAEPSLARTGNLISVTTRDWHGVWQLGEWKTWFFDRRADPDALSRLDSVSPAVRKPLRQEVSSLLEQQGIAREELVRRRKARKDHAKPLGPPVQIREQLRALGYAE